MAEVKHTPGWRWERSGCRVYSEEFHRGRPVKVADVSVANLTEDELNFRGRLIAAAPDLFEAAGAIAPYLGATDKNDWRGLDDDDAISMPVKIRVGDLRALRAALSKATAQQEGR